MKLPPMSALAVRRLILSGIALALAVAIALGVFHRDIDVEAATGIADRMLVQYRKGSGESPRNFGGRETRQWADGWEFRWRYRPCPDYASLRIWISRDGRRANYSELPECSLEPGAGRIPLTV